MLVVMLMFSTQGGVTCKAFIRAGPPSGVFVANGPEFIKEMLGISSWRWLESAACALLILTDKAYFPVGWPVVGRRLSCDKCPSASRIERRSQDVGRSG